MNVCAKKRKLRIAFGVTTALGAMIAAFVFTPLSWSQSPGVPTLTIEGLGKGIVELSGPWQFHLGDDPLFASPGIDDATGHSGWEQISANQSWGAQGHRSYQGYAWYRLHLHLTPAPGASPNFALLIPQIDDVYEIYWNGTLVAHNGKMPPYPSWRESQSAQVFSLGSPRNGVLAMRVWARPLFSYETGLQGGMIGAPLIGGPAAIADHKAALDNAWLRHNLYFLGLQSLYAALFVLSLLLWLRDRSQRVLLWMAVFCCGELAFIFLRGWHLPITFAASYGFGQLALATRDIGVWFLLLWLLDLNQNPRLVRFTKSLAVVYLIFAGADALLPLFDLGAPQIAIRVQIIDAVLTPVYMFSELYPLVLVIFAVRKRLDSARWAVAVFVFLTEMINVSRDVLVQGCRFTHWTIGQTIEAPLFTLYGNPFSADTLAGTGLLLAIIYAVYHYSREAIQRRQILEQEFRSAQELQQVLIPETLPSLPGYAVTSAYRPAQEVGGDFFQLIVHADSSALLILGDVSGKGLRAAMAVSLIVGAIRTLSDISSDPAEILAGLNRHLHGRLQGGFVTCLVLRLDADGNCRIANAGHPSPYLNRSEIPLSGAFPLGLVPVARYDTTSIRLDIGDRLTLYTDGLLEARNVEREIFGFDRLRELIATRPDAQQATETAVNFGQEDDITVLTLTRLAIGEESTTHLSAPALAPA